MTWETSKSYAGAGHIAKTRSEFKGRKTSIVRGPWNQYIAEITERVAKRYE